MKKCLHAAFLALIGENFRKMLILKESLSKKESGTEIGNSLEFDFVDNPKTIERLGLLSQPLFSVFGYQTIIFYGIPLYDAIMTKVNSVEDSAINSSAIHANLAILSHP